MTLTFGSLFAGIGGFDVGLERSGMKCVWQVERDKHCNSVLERHWPGMQRLDDVRNVTATRLVRPDWLCGGFPCQDLSVAGRRAGLSGERSGLFFEFVRIIREFSPSGFLIENVPGLLSSWSGDSPGSLDIDAGPGREMDLVETSDLSTVLDALSELRYGLAYRIYDAQYFRVAQRRRRVFIVGCLGSWRRAAEILFESESLPWHPAPSREAGARVAASLTRGANSGGRGGYAGRRREDDVNLSLCLKASRSAKHDPTHESYVVGPVCHNGKAAGSATQQDAESGLLVAHTLRAHGFDASEDGTGRGTPIIPICEFNGGTSSRGAGPNGAGIGNDGDPMFTLQAAHQHAIAFDERNITSPENRSNPQPNGPCHTLHASAPAIAYRTSGNCGVMEQGDRTAALNCATDPNQQIIVGGFKRGQGAKARSDGYQVEQAPTLTSSNSGTQQSPGVHVGMSVRRLTPRECERLQGFDDDWTRWAADGTEIADGPRYQMIGNAVCGHVSEFIGHRIVRIK